jgi:hypothetical protein
MTFYIVIERVSQIEKYSSMLVTKSGISSPFNRDKENFRFLSTAGELRQDFWRLWVNHPERVGVLTVACAAASI